MFSVMYMYCRNVCPDFFHASNTFYVRLSFVETLLSFVETVILIIETILL